MFNGFSDRLLSAKETCEMLDLSLPTLRRMTKARALPFVRIGARVLFEPDSLRAFIAERRVAPITSETAKATV